MTKSEVLEIISNGENSEVEFKRDDIRPEQIAKEIIAFSNSYGGRLLIGVEDNGRIVGIKRDNLEEWIMDTVCGRYIHPALIPKYEEIKIDEKNRIAVITVFSGVSKPYVLIHNDREDIFVRSGSVSKLATREQIIRLSESGGLLHVELMPVPNTSFKNLDKARLENYFRDIIKDPFVPKTDNEWLLRLTDMGFLSDLPSYDKVCTIAGLTLFGIKPRRYLKQAGIRLMVFDSQDLQYKALLDTVIDAPMLARRMENEIGSSILIDEGLIEKTVSQLIPFITVESETIDMGLRREKKWLYPLEVIRELLLNALAHRDWTRNTDIEIIIYRDRLEITSPGALPNSMTVEKMIAGRRTPRNPIIMEVLRDYQYVDARGMEIRVKVIPIMYEFNHSEPVFDATDDYLKTTLRPAQINKTYNDPKKPLNDPKNDPKKTDIKEIILEILKNDPKASYEKIANLTLISKATIKRHLQKMKEENRISRKGAKNGGYWEIK